MVERAVRCSRLRRAVRAQRRVMKRVETLLVKKMKRAVVEREGKRRTDGSRKGGSEHITLIQGTVSADAGARRAGRDA